MTITFYDLPSKLDGNAWSPSTFKTRISLNYKGIPYKAEWVEYPDIEPLLKKLGGAPTSKKADGRDHYTLPAIHDSVTGKVVMIAAYLDETYPNTPALFPTDTRAAIEVFGHVLAQNLSPILPIMLPATNNILNPPSEVYFRRTKEDMFQKKLEDIAPSGPVRDEIWAKFKEGFERMAGFYDKNGMDKSFFFGDTFSFAEVTIIGFLVWAQIVLGSNSEEWKAVASRTIGKTPRADKEMAGCNLMHAEVMN